MDAVTNDTRVPREEAAVDQAGRLAVGSDLLKRAALRETKPVAGALASFRTAQKSLGGLNRAFVTAGAARDAAQHARDSARRELHARLDPLAAALVAAGEPAANPFRGFGFSAPEAIVQAEALASNLDAGLSQRLIAAVRARPSTAAHPAVAAALTELDAAAARLLAAASAIPPLAEAARAAGERLLDAAQEWEIAWFALRRAARADAPALYAWLFEPKRESGTAALKTKLRSLALLFLPTRGTEHRAAWKHLLTGTKLRAALTAATLATTATGSACAIHSVMRAYAARNSAHTSKGATFLRR